MKTITKYALAAFLAGGAALAVATPASAQVSFGFSVGTPGYRYAPPRYDGCAYSSRYYDPYYCANDYWYEPVYFGGRWYNGPHRYTYRNNTRYFYIGGNWRRDEWRGGARPQFNGGRGYGGGHGYSGGRGGHHR